MKGKLIVIEGTDCSGKHTQTLMLVDNLTKQGLMVKAFQFPKYDTPTGRIIGGPYLGKPDIGLGYFPEGAPAVPVKVASLYFAADRLYNIKPIINCLESGCNVVLDRYVESNMAFQGGKIFDKKQRYEMYDFLAKLEYEILQLPLPDVRIFLHMPYESACELKKHRPEVPDQHEQNEHILRNAENAYKEIADLYSYITISCVNKKQIKSIDEIADEVLEKIKKLI